MNTFLVCFMQTLLKGKHFPLKTHQNAVFVQQVTIQCVIAISRKFIFQQLPPQWVTSGHIGHIRHNGHHGHNMHYGHNKHNEHIGHNERHGLISIFQHIWWHSPLAFRNPGIRIWTQRYNSLLLKVQVTTSPSTLNSKRYVLWAEASVGPKTTLVITQFITFEL